MNIKIAYLTQGSLMGDFEELDTYEVEKRWRVANPVFVAVQPNNVSLVPFLGITTSKEIILTEKDIRFGGLFDPALELRNHYSSQFGSGIQLTI